MADNAGQETPRSSRYVIDLLHHADAAAAKHKVRLFLSWFVACLPQTSKYYRRAILPLPRMLTRYLDELRQYRPKDSHWVFVNTRGKVYEPGHSARFVVFVSVSLSFVQPPGPSLSSRALADSAELHPMVHC